MTSFLDLTAEPSGDDGQDPKRFFDKRTWHRRPTGSRKGLQLCGQVRDALQSIFAGCGDPMLQALTVVAVDPAPNSGRLKVTVVDLASTDVTDRRRTEQHLREAVGFVRTQVAAAICRRRVPELIFEVG